jgi:hypothetical protein
MSEPPIAIWRAPDPQPISMEYSLRHSSASLRVSCGHSTFSIREFGNVTDGLGDLVRAALAVATGQIYADVMFDAEPQRWGLAVEPAGLSDNHTRVMRLTIKDGGRTFSSEGMSGLPVREWVSVPLLDCHVTSDDFARAVQQIASEARRDFDDATYRGMWGHAGSVEGFPLRALKALETALTIPEYRGR